MTKYLFIFIQNLSLLFQKNIPLFSLKVGKVLSEPYNNHYFFILIVPNICNIVQSGKYGKSQKIFFFADFSTNSLAMSKKSSTFAR